jgi:hypothetical protein
MAEIFNLLLIESNLGDQDASAIFHVVADSSPKDPEAV